MGIPVVDLNNVNLTFNSIISAADLFSTTDPDGDAIDFYLVEDFQPNPNGGFFSLNGIAQPNGSRFRVEASELDTLTYQAGSSAGFEGYRVIAFDVNGDFSIPANTGRINTVNDTNLVRPIVRDIPATVLANESIPITDLLSAFDPDGFPITRWFIRDRNVDSSFLTVDGVPQPQGEFFFVNANQLDQVAYNSFNGATFGVETTEQLDKFAFDGNLFSDVSTSEITTLPNVNHAVAQATRAGNVLTGEQVSLAPFSTIVDDDGNSIKFFEFRNTSPHAVHGNLILDGVVQPRQEWFQVSPQQLEEGRLVFEGGQTNISQQIRFRGNDGNFTGISAAIVFDNDTPLEVLTVLDGPGLIYDQQLETYELGTLLPAIGDAGLVSYQVFDAASGTGASARFELNSNVLPAGIIHEVTAEQVANNELVFLTGNDLSRSTDDIYVRTLNDRGNFSQWERLTVRTEPEFIRSTDVGSNWLSVPGITFDPEGRVNLPYSFAQTIPDYPIGEATDGPAPNNFSSLNEEERDAVRLAFDQLESLANINFFEVSDNSINSFGGQGGIWRFGNYGQDSNVAAFAFGPSTFEQGGDIYFNRFNLGTATAFDPVTGDPVAFDDPTLTPGSPAFTTLLHEIQHSLGYHHVFDLSAGSTTLPLDTRTDYFSVLSTFTGERLDGLFPTTPQLYDVEAVQRNYGVNFDQFAGDTLHVLTDSSPVAGTTEFAITLFDGGGNDTFSLVGSDPTGAGGFANVVDLRAGSFSSVNGVEDSISLALRAEIENAIGSQFDDTLIGNHLANSIEGGAGNDLIDGQAGDDFLVGGVGSDRFIFGIGDGSDVIDEQLGAGRDTIEIAQFGNLDSLSEDFRFRREGRDLIISLHLDDQESSDGTLRITNQAFGRFRIETLELNGAMIDLVDLGQQATAVDQKFELTGVSSVFGELVTPV